MCASRDRLWLPYILEPDDHTKHIKHRHYLLNQCLQDHKLGPNYETLHQEEPCQNKSVSYEEAPPRARILELVRPEDPEREALEAIVRPTPRRLARPLDEDTRRFLQRAMQPPAQRSASPHRSLAEELREAEQGCGAGGAAGSSVDGAAERERLGRLALAVEEDEGTEGELSGAARRLDALLAESRSLHAELAGIQEDLQVLARRFAPDV